MNKTVRLTKIITAFRHRIRAEQLALLRMPGGELTALKFSLEFTGFLNTPANRQTRIPDCLEEH